MKPIFFPDSFRRSFTITSSDSHKSSCCFVEFTHAKTVRFSVSLIGNKVSILCWAITYWIDGTVLLTSFKVSTGWLWKIKAREFEPIRNIEVFWMNNNVWYLFFLKKVLKKKPSNWSKCSCYQGAFVSH